MNGLRSQECLIRVRYGSRERLSEMDCAGSHWVRCGLFGGDGQAGVKQIKGETLAGGMMVRWMH